MQKIDNKSSKRFEVFSIVFIVFSVCSLLILDPISLAKTALDINYLRGKLPQARTRWLAHQIQDYSIEVDGYTAWDTCKAKLIVRQGELAEVEVHRPPIDPTEMSKLPIPTDEWVAASGNYPQCEYGEFTILAFLERTDEFLSIANPWDDQYQVSFDPHWGYISSYKYHSHFGFGVLGWNSIADGDAYYEFSDFQPLAP